MISLSRNTFFTILALTAAALILKFGLADHFLTESSPLFAQIVTIIVIFVVGVGYVFRGTTHIIEETTDVLKDRTGLAGGLLQSFGTAFPDMIIGVVAALLSLQFRGVDEARAINLAILAAAATFGSNIYNIVHATWCIWRQNLANALNKSVLMLPDVPSFGTLTPIASHRVKPTVPEMDAAIRVLSALTFLTGFAAIAMVLFGKVDGNTVYPGDLYQLVPAVGFVLFALGVAILYLFRKDQRVELSTEEMEEEEAQLYGHQPTWRIWFDLVISGVAILFAAEAMVRAMESLSYLAHIPFVVTGVLAGIIGCLGEMIIVHNFSVNPKGRIGDAVVGVAMDNIVTTLGAALVAIMGGIFLGGDSLILIFIVILASNTFLIDQVSRLKNSLYHRA